MEQVERLLHLNNRLGEGPVWNVSEHALYWVNIEGHCFYHYHTNRRAFVRTPDDPSTPDGLTVDSEGFIWCARWGGWKVVRYDPTGKVEREIRLPVEYPTSCAFGGEALDELYITSAWTRLSEAQRKEQPDAGDIFRLKTNIKGLPEPLFAG